MRSWPGSQLINVGPLHARLAKTAPGIGLVVLPWHGATPALDDLARGTTDLGWPCARRRGRRSRRGRRVVVGRRWRRLRPLIGRWRVCWCPAARLGDDRRHLERYCLQLPRLALRPVDISDDASWHGSVSDVARKEKAAPLPNARRQVPDWEEATTGNSHLSVVTGFFVSEFPAIANLA